MQTKPGASKNLFFVLADSVKENGAGIAEAAFAAAAGLPSLILSLSLLLGLRRGAYTGLSASMLRQMTCQFLAILSSGIINQKLNSPVLDSLTRFGVYDVLKTRLRSPQGLNKCSLPCSARI